MDLIDYCLVFHIMPLIPVSLLIIICATRISNHNREIRAEVAAARIFHVIFTYYRRPPRMFLRLTLDFIGRELRLMSSSRSCRWSKQLPEDIMELILQRLSLSDFFRCGAVCRSWQASTKSIQCRLAPVVPWLVLWDFNNKGDHCLWSLSDWKVHKLLAPSHIPDSFPEKLHRWNCFGSIEGWLIMVDVFTPKKKIILDFWISRTAINPTVLETIEYYFWNPASGVRVMLPSIPGRTLICRKCVPNSNMKLVASSEPTTRSQRAAHGCFVVSLCGFGHLAFCRLTDKSWTSIYHMVPFVDVVIMDDKIYAATRDVFSYIMVYDIVHNANDNGRPSYRSQVLGTGYPWLSLERWIGDDELAYLAKDPVSMELFMIIHKVNVTLYPNICSVRGGMLFKNLTSKGFKVFKLDEFKEWVEVVDLGDRVLFMTKAEIKCISTNNNNDNGALNHSPHCWGEMILRNSIYFAFDYRSSTINWLKEGPDFGVFSLTDKSIRNFTLPPGFSGAAATFPVWFTPSPCLFDLLM